MAGISSLIVLAILLCSNAVFAAVQSYDFKVYPALITLRSYLLLQISWITASPDGVERKVIGINGKYPAPTIVLNLGDTLVVNATNVDIVNGTTLHWHGMMHYIPHSQHLKHHQKNNNCTGMYLKGQSQMDGSSFVTQCPIAPGESFQYKFTVNQTGTYWYHGHLLTKYPNHLFCDVIFD